MATTSKIRKKPRATASAARRQERRFSTSSTYIDLRVAIVGMIGAVILGAGVFGLWLLDPPFAYASYLVAVGGLGLGVALWFGQPAESTVAVGDAGIAVEDGREVSRMRWYAMKSIRIVKGRFSAEGGGKTVSFSVGANPAAAAWALKEAAERVPQIMDVDKVEAAKLPKPETKGGQLVEIDNDQLAGSRCAASDKLITLEEDARICGTCSQVYEKTAVPERCISCNTEMKSNTRHA